MTLALCVVWLTVLTVHLVALLEDYLMFVVGVLLV